jgi:hypothetical protein
MIMLSALDLDYLENDEPVEKESGDYSCGDQGRRMSLMTALKMNLERTSIIEPLVTSQIRRMSMEQQRSYTYDLLSQV